MLKKVRDWDDERLCRKLRISDKAIEAIKNRHKPGPEAVGLKMLYELFPQVAVQCLRAFLAGGLLESCPPPYEA